MSTIKEFNHKLRSLKNTRKITKTMKMVAASKLRKAQIAQANAKIYAYHVRQLISRVAATVDSSSHSLLESRIPVKRVLILLFTSDKGLCGAFNNNVIKAVERWINVNRSKYAAIELSCCGKRGYMYFRKRMPIKRYYEQAAFDPSFQHAQTIGRDLQMSFTSGEYDEVYVTHNQFFSPLSQKTTFERILPIDPDDVVADKAPASADYLFEPPKGELLAFLIPHYLYFRIFFTLLENAAGEHGARMTAMDNATKNALELIDTYTLLRNRARQAAITTELTEIIAGAEAL